MLVSRLTRVDTRPADALAVCAIAENAGTPIDLDAEFDRDVARIWVCRATPEAAPVAFLLAWHVADEVQLLDIATSTPARRRGAGRALMGALREFAAEAAARVILLELRRSNHAALALYRSVGFSLTSLRRDYYAKPLEDALLMALTLDPSSGQVLPGRDEIPLPEPMTKPAKRQQTTRLVHRESMGKTYHLLTFDMPEGPMPLPGQFAMIRGANWGDAPLLPRPMSYLTGGERPSILIKIIGDGTGRLARAEPGEPFEVLGPLGNTWREPTPGKTPVLVAGGVGVAPLLFLARELAARGVACISIYGGRSAQDLPMLEDLSEVSQCHATTEDGSDGTRGRVTDVLERLLDDDVEVYSCGPDAMMAAVARQCAERNVRCTVSLEAPMACGYGVCLGCPIALTGGGYLYTCVDGPCVDAAIIDWQASPKPLPQLTRKANS